MRKTPQIPRDVFFDEEQGDQAVIKSNNEDTNHVNRQAIKASEDAQSSDKRGPQRQKGRHSRGQKVQITVYLGEEVLQELERGRYELFARHRLRVPKSAIVEQAIVQALGDLGALAAALEGRNEH